MSAQAKMDGQRIWNWLRVIGWSGAAILLMLPLIAMQYTSEVNWSLSDFLVMGALLGMAGLTLELATRRSTNLSYRFASAFAVAAAFLLVWVNGAVGLLGDEGNPANLMFLGVIIVAILGAVIVRARSAGMAQVLLVTAAVQLLAGIIGLAVGWASPGNQGIYEVVLGTALFAGLWLASAFLYSKAASAGA